MGVVAILVLGHLYKLWFPLPRRLHIKFGQVVSEEKIYEIVDDDNDDDRRWLDGYTVSSSCEPNGSGELKKQIYNFYDLFL